ncbi:T/G mismatch-specific endonuclease [Ensifer adhaerens]|nr:T/G mismatch-specific endonuclease [Ensifer adhaerens]
MADIVPVDVRSRMMSGIRGTNTRPELQVRKALHAAGFRYRLHERKLPGKPDLVLPKYRAVIFVHGCFWHGHGCHLFRMPSSNSVFWQEKIAGNVARDKVAVDRLRESGWRVATVWECALKGKTRRKPEEITERLAEWLRGQASAIEIGGGTE